MCESSCKPKIFKRIRERKQQLDDSFIHLLPWLSRRKVSFSSRLVFSSLALFPVSYATNTRTWQNTYARPPTALSRVARLVLKFMVQVQKVVDDRGDEMLGAVSLKKHEHLSRTDGIISHICHNTFAAHNK